MAKANSNDTLSRATIIAAIIVAIVGAGVTLYTHGNQSNPPPSADYILSGTVEDYDTGQAINQATVVLLTQDGSHQTKNTDADGLFSFRLKDAIGDSRVKITKDDYKPYDKSISRQEGAPDIRLRRIVPVAPAPVSPSDGTTGGNPPPPTSDPAAISYDPDNGHYYQLVEVPEGITWTSARTAAAAKQYNGMPGHLATITDQNENAFIVAHCGNDRVQCKWLGGYKSPTDPENPAANWHWITGEPWQYTNWAVGEPGNAYGDDENALMLKWTDTGTALGTWNDLKNDIKRYTSITFHGIIYRTMNGYIVEYEARKN
jgi:hypothetical protein